MSQTASADNDGDAAEQIARTVAAAEEQRLDGTAVSVTEPGGELSCRPRFRELLSLLLIVVIADVTLYRGQGFAGPGLFFIAVPVLLLTGVVRSQFHRSLWLMGVLLLFLAARLLWCGSLEAVFAGAGLLCGFIMSLSGRAPWLLQTVAHTAQLIPDGYVGLSHYYESLSGCRMKPPEGRVLAIVLPALTVSAFATLFLFANPDLLSTVSAELTRLIEQTQQWLREFAPGPMELLFWITTGWIATGALRPSAPLSDDPVRETGLVEESTQESSLFPA